MPDNSDPAPCSRSASDEHDHDLDHRQAAGGPLALAIALTAGFALVEVWGGWVSGSLALLSDAGHMLSDAFSLGLALAAHAYARRPPSNRASYGRGRAEVLAAFVNALAMLAIVTAIAVEAVQRLIEPAPVAGGTVLVVALAGLGVNVFVAWRLSTAADSLNARAALLHVMGDLLGSVAAIAAGAVVFVTGWTPIDPILSVFVALLILLSTARLLRQTTSVLLEQVPAHLDYATIGEALAAIGGVREVHDLHVWSVGAGEIALSAHLGLSGGERWPSVLAEARRLLAQRWAIRHVTLQPDWPVAPQTAASIPIVPVRPGGEK